MRYVAATSAFLAGFLAMGRPGWAAHPEAAAYTWDASKIFWFMHISDTHLGTEFYSEDARFRWALEEAQAVIEPLFVVNTGDLVDGSPNGVVTSGQDEGEWQLYRSILDDTGMTPDFYIDIPGNHDAYGDADLAYYLQYSLHGSTEHKLTWSMELDLGFGQYFFYGTATCGEDGARFLEHPEITDEELQEMASELQAHDGHRLIFVFGHHPIRTPANGDQAHALLEQHKAFYFHGHVHEYKSYLDGQVCTYEVGSLGKQTTRNLAVVAVDNDAVSYAATDSDNPWPLVVVTAPVASRFTNGDPNPYAYEVCNTAAAVPVRALVFDVNTISAVTVSAGATQDGALVQDAANPHLWTGSFDPRGLGVGEAELTLTAYGSEPRTVIVPFRVGTDACPAPPGDAGPSEDAGGDAGIPEDGGGWEDARTPDAGVDAEALEDGQVTDASAPDGATGSWGRDQGCGCRQTTPTHAIWLGLMFLWLARRQRASRRGSRRDHARA